VASFKIVLADGSEHDVAGSKIRLTYDDNKEDISILFLIDTFSILAGNMPINWYCPVTIHRNPITAIKSRWREFFALWIENNTENKEVSE